MRKKVCRITRQRRRSWYEQAEVRYGKIQAGGKRELNPAAPKASSPRKQG